MPLILTVCIMMFVRNLISFLDGSSPCVAAAWSSKCGRRQSDLVLILSEWAITNSVPGLAGFSIAAEHGQHY